MSKPGKEHWTGAISWMSKRQAVVAVKRVFRYLRGTASYGLCYKGRPGLDSLTKSVSRVVRGSMGIAALDC
jgi:hypothetical protein